MAHIQDTVQKLWTLCHVLRDDGITYQDYITELTWLLFLKMAEETGKESQLPKGYRWADLESKPSAVQLTFYQDMLLHLGTSGRGSVRQIFGGASTSLRHPRNLARLVESIDTIDWYSARDEGLGVMYEGLLEKNASEQKSGAGQYFTPRQLIHAMVDLVKPQAGEIIQDPAAGTGGFLVAANQYIKNETQGHQTLSDKEILFQYRKAFVGVELVPSAYRLCLMNLLLHGIEGDIRLGDCLSPDNARLPKPDVILTNPPFGTRKGGGAPTRGDLTFSTSNKQLAFLQHAYQGLKPGGRAAIILPDNVLFEEGIGARIRTDLMNKCNLHTILRLPTGIFYAHGVKTNVLFFYKGKKNKLPNTKKIWIYDLRTNMQVFGRRAPLERETFIAFRNAFGSDPYGNSRRKDEGDAGRFRVFTREQISARGDSLDLSWLKEDGSSFTTNPNLPEPEKLATEVLVNMQTAMQEMRAVLTALKRRGSLL